MEMEMIKRDFHTINNLLTKITIQAGQLKYRLQAEGIDAGNLEKEKEGFIKVLSDFEEYALDIGGVLKGLRSCITEIGR